MSAAYSSGLPALPFLRKEGIDRCDKDSQKCGKLLCKQRLNRLGLLNAAKRDEWEVCVGVVGAEGLSWTSAVLQVPWKFNKAYFFSAFLYMNLGSIKWNDQMDLSKQAKTRNTYIHM